jgi:ankyrin repeat protein
LEIIKYLVETAGSNVDAANADGNTPLHYASRFGKLEIVKYLVGHCGADIHAADNTGATPLHEASRCGWLEVVQYLVETAGADIHTSTMKGDTPLHYASRYGHLEIVRYFVEETGADVQAVNKDLDTPLHLASERRYTSRQILVGTVWSKHSCCESCWSHTVAYCLPQPLQRVGCLFGRFPTHHGKLEWMVQHRKPMTQRKLY